MPRSLSGALATIIAAVLLLAAVSSPLSAIGAEPGFRAGAAAIDVTPPKFPVSMIGSFQDRKAITAHDPLHARALVLDDGSVRIAFVVVDSCVIGRETYEAAKRMAAGKTGIPAHRMLMSATHTHTAPAAIQLAQIHPDPEYVEFLTGQIVRAVVEAEARLAPAEIGWGVAQVPDEVHNRRWKMKPGSIPPNPFGRIDRVQMNPPVESPNLVEPAGRTDPDLTVLSVRTREGRPICLFANYPLHYVGGIPPEVLSADYFGEFARQIEERIAGEAGDPPFVGILSNAASGDVNSINFRERQPPAQPYERMRLVAGKVADAAAKVYAGIEHKPSVSLAMAERDIELAVRRPNTEELAEARAILDKADGPVLKTLPEIYANEQFELSRYPETVPVKLQALRVGEVGIATIPCEPFVEIGLEIKQRSPLKPTCIIGLANGYNGYLPTPEHHELAGYETWRARWSYLEPAASRKITEALLELLQTVAVPAPR